MARLPRLALDGEAHLVVLRGHSGQPVFTDAADRIDFLADLREAAARHRVAVEAYTLLADHVHLLLRPAQAAGLGAMVQALGRRYVARFNRRHGRSGTLWAGRYRAALLQAGPLVLQAMLFIDSHAHRSGQVAKPEDDAWSSAAHHLGRRRDPTVADGPAWWALGNTPFEREAAYRALMHEGVPAQQVRALADASHRGWPLGQADWLAQLAQQAARPVAPRPRGRPARAA
jgi:putative transposase